MCGGFMGKLAKSVTMPFDTIKASDPLTQFLTGNKVDFNADHNLDAALNEGYDDDPIGGSLLTKDDYKRSGKVAAGAAAAFFGGGALAGAMGSGGTTVGTGVGTGTATGTGLSTTFGTGLSTGTADSLGIGLTEGSLGGVGGGLSTGVGTGMSAATADSLGIGLTQGAIDGGLSGESLTAAGGAFGTGGASLGDMANAGKALSSTSGGLSNLSTLGNLAKIGGSIYDKYAANQKAGVLQNNADELNNMYQPGTPEYELWKQTLDRRDAAQGRRSQYGPRSVELAAAMAKQRSANLTSSAYSNLLGGALDNKYGGLQSLFNNGNAVAGAVKGAPQLYNSISSLFSNGGNTTSNLTTASDNTGSTGSDLLSQTQDYTLPDDTFTGFGNRLF